MAAAAVAAKEVKRPVRLWVPMEVTSGQHPLPQDNMRMLGKRNQYLFDYKIGLSASGKIQASASSLFN